MGQRLLLALKRANKTHKGLVARTESQINYRIQCLPACVVTSVAHIKQCAWFPGAVHIATKPFMYTQVCTWLSL